MGLKHAGCVKDAKTHAITKKHYDTVMTDTPWPCEFVSIHTYIYVQNLQSIITGHNLQTTTDKTCVAGDNHNVIKCHVETISRSPICIVHRNTV